MRILLSIGLISILLVSCSSSDRRPQMGITLSQSQVSRGSELVNGLAACGFCHAKSGLPNSPLSGGDRLADLYGEVIASNITPSKSGVGDWSPKQLFNVLRKGQSNNERQLSPEVHGGYEWLSDSDLWSVISYLAALKPSENQVAPRDLSFITRNTTGFFESPRTVEGYVSQIDRKHEGPYGRYLTDHVARCSSCHSSPATLVSSPVYLGGGKGFVRNGQEKIAPALLPAINPYMASWQEAQFVNYLTTGKTPDNRIVDKSFCPINYYSQASGDDLLLIARYLKSLN